MSADIRHAVVLGTFDGVHRGHRTLLTAARDLAPGTLSAVTFWPHPRAVVSGQPVDLLATRARRHELLARHADDVVELEFNEDLQGLSPDGFIADIIIDRLDADCALVGENFRFGAGGAGTPETLVAAMESAGRHARVVELCGTGTEAISSSRIRELLRTGAVGDAADLLGWHYRWEGEVVHGAARGRELGFPTLNVAAADPLLLPADGVYAGRVMGLSPEPLPAAVSIGTNPQFGDELRGLEAHVLDWDGDAYGRDVVVELIARTRGQAVFASVDELLTQMHADVHEIRDVLRDIPSVR